MNAAKLSIELELLEDAGVSAQEVCKKILSRTQRLLQKSESLDLIPTDTLLCCLRLLTQYIQSNKAKVGSISKSIVDEILNPYLQIVANTNYSQSLSFFPCTDAIKDLFLSLLSSEDLSQKVAVHYLSSLLKSTAVCLSAPGEHSLSNLHFVLRFISDTLQKTPVWSLEKNGIDFSDIFEQAVNLLKLSDAKMCFVLASAIVPCFITAAHRERAERLWSLVEAVHLGRVNIEHTQVDFVLTILCCCRDIFIHHDQSSPFSSPFTKAVRDLSPLIDIRVKSTFWKIIQEGLVSSDPYSRKRCMYLLHSVFVSVRSSKKGDVISSEGEVFWWAAESDDLLGRVWDDLVLVLETMEEKQIHIVKPVKKHLQSVLEASRQQCNKRYLLHISWVHVALSRVFDHHEAKSIIHWGVMECLGMQLSDSPLLQPDNWSFVSGKLLQVLGQSFLYNRVQDSSQDGYPPVAKQLTSFLQSFVTNLEKDHKGPFLALFLSACAKLKLAEVPLVFVSHAVSELKKEPLIEGEGMAAIRSIVLSSILTHKPSLRAASQSFLLKAVCELTDHQKVGYLEITQTIGSFRSAECLRFGSPTWKQTSKFLLYCTTSNEESGELFAYLQSCVQAYLDTTFFGGTPLPTLPSLARVLVLAIYEECTTNTRTLSSDSHSLLDSLTLLMAPVMDTVTMATTRVYLAADILSNALEFFSSLMQLLPCQPENTTAQIFYKCLSPWLPDTVLYLQTQLVQGLKVGGAPSLDLTLSYLNTLDSVCKFIGVFGPPFSKHSDIALGDLTRRAGDKLTSQCSKQDVVEVSAPFLGSITILGWLSSCLTSSHHALSSVIPHSIIQTLSATLSNLPHPLRLSKPVPITSKARSVSDDPVVEINEDSDSISRLTAHSAQVEWGPLLSYCLGCYWKCLLYVMREDFDWVSAKGIDSLVQICLDGLDSASESLSTILQCLAFLVSKSRSGSSLCAFVGRVWSLIVELRDKPKLFNDSLEAFVQLIFHPSLLLVNKEPGIVQLQEKYIEEFFLLGESKTGVCSILVDHVCLTWSKLLLQTTSPILETPSSDKTELIISLQAHNQLLLKACTFGTVHRKNLRIISDTEDFLDSVGVAISLPEGSRGDVCVRVKVLVFLLELFVHFSTNHEGAHLNSELQEFLHQFLSTLISEVLKMSGNTPKYYINSHTHRVKLRLLQVLILSIKYAGKITCELVAKRLVTALQFDNQRSVRYLMEWASVLILTRFPDLIGPILYPCLAMDSECRLSRLPSFLTIAMHIGTNLHVSQVFPKANYYKHVIPVLLGWASSHHFTVRMYSQAVLHRMWEDCRRSKVKVVLEKFQILAESIPFTQQHGDCVKFIHKLKENIFFSLVHTLGDLNLQTVFHTLPLLCEAPREDLISTENFLSQTKEVMKLGYDLYGENQELLNAALGVLSSTSQSQCGSDTRSIAHQLGSKNGSTSESESHLSSNTDIQKKITPWSNPRTVVKELFPDSSTNLLMAGTQEESSSNGLVLVTSLLSKIPNIGGLCRTCEIFGVSELVVDNKSIIANIQFQSLSVTSENWINITEIKLNALKEYLLVMQGKGFTLVGAEQTARSKYLTKYSFMDKTVLLLGNEREGIPVDLIQLLDDCVEIPQLGVIRSLNVHVSGALFVWEYAKQHSLQANFNTL